MPKDEWSSANQKDRARRAARAIDRPEESRLEAEADRLLAAKSAKNVRFESEAAESFELKDKPLTGAICCSGKALAVFRVTEGETRVDVTCRFCQRVIEANLPQKEAARRARKGNFFLIEPADEGVKRAQKAKP